MVRQIAVEGRDDPVAIAPGLAKIALGRQLDQVASVGVADDVEPVPAPALAIPGRGQQAIDDPRERFGRSIGEEGVDLLGRRRQADQVERGPPDQRASVGRRRRVPARVSRGPPARSGRSASGTTPCRGPPARRTGLDRLKRPEPSLRVGHAERWASLSRRSRARAWSRARAARAQPSA